MAGALGGARSPFHQVWAQGPASSQLKGRQVVRAGLCGPSPWGSLEEGSLVSSWGIAYEVSVDDKGSM